MAIFFVGRFEVLLGLNDFLEGVIQTTLVLH